MLSVNEYHVPIVGLKKCRSSRVEKKSRVHFWGSKVRYPALFAELAFSLRRAILRAAFFPSFLSAPKLFAVS